MSRRIPIRAALGAFASSGNLRLPGLRLCSPRCRLPRVPRPNSCSNSIASRSSSLPATTRPCGKAFIEAAGLDVEIKPGSPPGASPIDPVREVTEGRAQFGTGTVQLLVRAAQGQSLLLLAPVFQQSGAAVYYRADRDLSLPTALLAGRVGRLPASNILDLELRTALYGVRDRSAKGEICLDGAGAAIDDLASRTRSTPRWARPGSCLGWRANGVFC